MTKADAKAISLFIVRSWDEMPSNPVEPGFTAGETLFWFGFRCIPALVTAALSTASTAIVADKITATHACLITVISMLVAAKTFFANSRTASGGHVEPSSPWPRV